MNLLTSIKLSLPSWINKEIDFEKKYIANEEKMQVALKLAKLNFTNKTGGPFGAIVCEEESSRIISVGVNRVIPETCSIAHAEIMAIILAQSLLGKYRLNSNKKKKYLLISTAQPCSMCIGAISWAGIDKLIYGATRRDIENIIGFDEGPVHLMWKRKLKSRNIMIAGKVLRREACEVLKIYKASSGIIY